MLTQQECLLKYYLELVFRCRSNFKNKGGVKGLTTAAGMWATACIGIAVGYGYYELAILGGLFVMIALFVLRIINTFLFSQEKNVLILKLSNLDSIPFYMINLKKSTYRKKYGNRMS